MIEVVHEDNHLLVVNKPAGLLAQGDHTGDATLVDLAKAYLKEKYNKPGNVYLGLVHRLDRPASGLVVLAKTSKAASRLSEQFRKSSIEKYYTALVEGLPPSSGDWTDDLIRDEQHSRVARPGEHGGKKARLTYEVVAQHHKHTRVYIHLITGRHHQIRVQFAARKHPLLGDMRYHSTQSFPNRAIALHATQLSIDHPTTKERLTFRVEPNW